MRQKRPMNKPNLFTYECDKRGLFTWQKRPKKKPTLAHIHIYSPAAPTHHRHIYTVNDTHECDKTGLFMWQKRPIYVAKEAYDRSKTNTNLQSGGPHTSPTTHIITLSHQHVITSSHHHITTSSHHHTYLQSGGPHTSPTTPPCHTPHTRVGENLFSLSPTARCVCVCVCVCVGMYVSTYICMHVSTYMYVYACM